MWLAADVGLSGSCALLPNELTLRVGHDVGHV